MEMKVKDENLPDNAQNQSQNFDEINVKKEFNGDVEELQDLKSLPSTECFVKPSYVKVSQSDTHFCPLCLQVLSLTTKFRPSKGFSELDAVKEKRLSGLNWGKALTINFKMTNACIYDENGCFVSITRGLMEDGVSIYLAGTLHNMTNQDQKIEKVEKVGPLVEWKKPFGIKLPLI